jgi:hypothetical protein
MGELPGFGRLDWTPPSFWQRIVTKRSSMSCPVRCQAEGTLAHLSLGHWDSSGDSALGPLAGGQGVCLSASTFWGVRQLSRSAEWPKPAELREQTKLSSPTG